jgi:hypothetical protein
MILQFATKRDANGNRYFLGIDTGAECFATDSRHWYSREDIIEISKRDRREIIDQLETNGWRRVDYI